MNLSFHDIQNFVETCNGNTISESAKRLGITQPALSESIKRLEKNLNGILFYRTKSGISLTPFGKSSLFKAKAILENVCLIKNNINEVLEASPISLGCHELVGSYVLPKALKLFSSQVPKFQLDLKHNLSRVIQEEIQRGKIDIGIVINPTRVPDIIIHTVAQDYVCVWSKHSKNIYSKILCNPELFQTMTILRKWKKRPVEMIHSGNLELLARLTNEGIGYGILPERVVHLLKLDLSKHVNLPIYTDQICIVHRPEFGKNKYEKLLIQCLRESLLN